MIIQAILAELTQTWTITEPHKYPDANVYHLHHPQKRGNVQITILNNEPHLIRIIRHHKAQDIPTITDPTEGFRTNPTIDLNHPNSIQQLLNLIQAEFNTRPNK